MATTNNSFQDAVMEALTQEVKARVKQNIDSQVEEFRKKIEAEADSIALKILKIYDVQSMADRIVITVRKESGDD